MKISKLLANKDIETFLLGVRTLPEDFYQWAREVKQYTICHTVSISVNISRITAILYFEKVWFEDLSGVKFYYEHI